MWWECAPAGEARSEDVCICAAYLTTSALRTAQLISRPPARPAHPLPPSAAKAGNGGKPLKVVAYDYGIKLNILRRLASFGCDVTVVPADFPAEKVLDMNPDGVFFSNGPVSRE
jgi:carbamoylphosphate synthase small subunit